jgi:transcriptional regulator with XRE-family HTH domain
MSDWIDKARDAMKRRGMTNLQLARELGVNQSTVGRWLSGRSIPGGGTLRRIGSLLGIMLADTGSGDTGDVQEAELLAAFRRMTPADRTLLLQCLRDREHPCHGRSEDPDG